MKVITKNIKTMTKLGLRGLILFLTKEAKLLGWDEKIELNVVVYEKDKKKGILIEKV